MSSTYASTSYTVTCGSDGNWAFSGGITAGTNLCPCLFVDGSSGTLPSNTEIKSGSSPCNTADGCTLDCVTNYGKPLAKRLDIYKIKCGESGWSYLWGAGGTTAATGKDDLGALHR